MARISTYDIDAEPNLGDKVIGTDTRSGLLTKNYTLGKIADLINQTNSLGVADQSIFLFQSDLSEGRDAGTISFAAGGGNGTAFSSINTILLSKSGAGNKNISNFLPLFIGKKIIIARIDDINNFGTYKVASMTDYIPDTSFLEVSLTSVEHNGSIEADKYYTFSEFSERIVAGGLIYQGGYNAATNTPDLDSSPSSSIKKGWTYTVTADGSFFTEQVRVGDVLISEVNSPTALADWTTVQNNIDLASSTQIGIGNVIQSPDADKKGIEVGYSDGTAKVGLNIDDITEISSLDDPDDSFIPFFNEAAGENQRIATQDLATELNGLTSRAFTITDTATVTHSLNTKDVIIQLYDITTNETVYADVDRISITQATITFATTPTNSIRVLVQKIG